MIRHGHHAVESSNIASIAYNKDTATLEVSFKNGTLYAYSSVPESRYHAMLVAPSKGKFLNSEIKPRHSAKRIA